MFDLKRDSAPAAFQNDFRELSHLYPTGFIAKIGEGKILSNQTKFAVLSRAPRVWSWIFTLFKMDLFRAAHG